MRLLSKLGCTTFLLWAVLWFSPPANQAQQSARPKQVLLLYWDDESQPANIGFARDLRAAMQSIAPGAVEYYSEYLEASRFRGGKYSELLRDYILQKYAG